MTDQDTPAWLTRFEELLTAPLGAQLIATSTNDAGDVEVLERLLLARHYLYLDDDGSGDPVVSFLVIGYNDGPTESGVELAESYFKDAPPRSACATRARVDDAGDVIFEIPVGSDEDQWDDTVQVRVSACSEYNTWVVDEWDNYRATLSNEEFQQRYVERITLG